MYVREMPRKYYNASINIRRDDVDWFNVIQDISSRLLCPISVASRYKAWVCYRPVAGIVGSNLARGIDVCCECSVLSDRVLCVGLITFPEESYRVWCVSSVMVKPRQ